MDQLQEVNEEDNNPLEEVVVNEGLHIPEATMQLVAQQKTSLSI